MALSVLPLDLARWDETARDCLVLPVFKDDRPLRGAAGLADWRLCGRLSRLLKANTRDRRGRRDDAAAAGPPAAVQARAVVRARRREGLHRRAVPQGPRVDPRRRQARPASTDWALQAPGRASGLIGARRAVEIILEDEQLVEQPITLLEDPAGQKDIAELLRSQR